MHKTSILTISTGYTEGLHFLWKTSNIEIGNGEIFQLATLRDGNWANGNLFKSHFKCYKCYKCLNYFELKTIPIQLKFTHVYTPVCTCFHTCLHPYVHMFTHMFELMFTNVNKHVFTHVHKHVCSYAHTCLH